MRDTVLAIDVGTQSTRAVLFTLDGTTVARCQVSHQPPYHSPEPDWATRSPHAYWRDLVEAVQGLWQQGVDPARVAGMAVTTLRGTVVPASESGEPLDDAIVWLDQRRATQLPPPPWYWRAAFAAVGAGDLIRGHQARAQCNWYAQHRPELWARCDKFVLLSGWLNHQLTGEWKDSAASAVGYLPFDYAALDWGKPRHYSWGMLALRRAQLPQLLPPGATLGALQASVAARLGLSAHTPVVAAAADKACEVLGSGLVSASHAHLSLGTTATVNGHLEAYREVERFLPAFPSALPGKWNAEIALSRGFWMVSWFKEHFAEAERVMAAAQGIGVETALDALLHATPPGADGLTLQATWSPGIRHPGPEARGAVIGFTPAHGRAHLYRALIEGLMLGLRAARDRLQQRTRTVYTQLIAAGGGSQSDAVLQIAADVMGTPVTRPQTLDTSALGAAMNTAVGLGLLPDYTAARQAMCKAGPSFKPNRQHSAIYDARFTEVYQPLYGRLKPLYQALMRATPSSP